MKDTSQKKLTTQQLADHMGVSTRTIANWKTTGVIPFIRIGRVVRFDLDEVEAGLKKIQKPRLCQRRKGNHVVRSTNPEKGATLLRKGVIAQGVKSELDIIVPHSEETPSTALLGFPETIAKMSISHLEECLTEALDNLERRDA